MHLLISRRLNSNSKRMVCFVLYVSLMVKVRNSQEYFIIPKKSHKTKTNIQSLILETNVSSSFLLSSSICIDIVPASPPFSLGFPFRTMKHTGINLRLTKNGYSTVHSSVGGFKNAVKNTFLSLCGGY